MMMTNISVYIQKHQNYKQNSIDRMMQVVDWILGSTPFRFVKKTNKA